MVLLCCRGLDGKKEERNGVADMGHSTDGLWSNGEDVFLLRKADCWVLLDDEGMNNVGGCGFYFRLQWIRQEEEE